MIIDFNQGKEANAERDKLLEHLQNFFSTLSEIKLEKEFVYVTTLAELFKSMRKSRFSDEDIDLIIYQAAFNQKREIRPVNNNGFQYGSL